MYSLPAFFYIFDFAKLSHKVKIVDVNIRSFFEAKTVLLEATLCFMSGNFSQVLP